MKRNQLWFITIAILVTAIIATVLLKFGATLGDDDKSNDYNYVKRGEQDCFCWDRMGTSSINWK